MQIKMNIKRLLGKKIKNLRVKKGLTQSELAKIVGISQRSLSGIEIGESFLTAETLEKILSGLNIEIEELFKLEHLKPEGELLSELLDKISSLNDENKIRMIYKVVNAILSE